ncbi:MAG TPA: HAMP domain-containing protein [Longimicrobiales bacterium]
MIGRRRRAESRKAIRAGPASAERGTREVAEGNFRYRLDTSRSDEFAQVARDFNTMTERLAELDGMKRDFVSPGITTCVPGMTMLPSGSPEPPP